MSDLITILITHSGSDIGKTISGIDLQQPPFQIEKQFLYETLRIHDLSSLVGVLKSLEVQSTKTVIRGRVRLTPSEVIRRDKNTIEAVGRLWCMVGIDNLAWDGDLYDHGAMLSYAIQQLPAEFQAADCWYHFSSSMGIKAGINVHLWFWLERRCSDRELKTWLAGCPVDMRMFNPMQI